MKYEIIKTINAATLHEVSACTKEFKKFVAVHGVYSFEPREDQLDPMDIEVLKDNLSWLVEKGFIKKVEEEPVLFVRGTKVKVRAGACLETYMLCSKSSDESGWVCIESTSPEDRLGRYWRAPRKLMKNEMTEGEIQNVFNGFPPSIVEAHHSKN
jgi:hypothetical protein